MKLAPRHVVIMVVALSTAAVLTPLSVGAATGTFTSIVDPVNATSKARVNAAGQLWVTQGDPTTKKQARVTDDGQQLVAATPLPEHIWDSSSTSAGVNGLVLTDGSFIKSFYSGIGANHLRITSMTFSLGTSGTEPVAMELLYLQSPSATGAGDCGALSGVSQRERMLVFVSPNQSTTVTFPTPLSWNTLSLAGHRFCLALEGSAGGTWTVNAFINGFTS